MSGSSKQEAPAGDARTSTQMPQSSDRGGGHRVDDLAQTASLLGSWMSDQKLTIAEQLAIVELLRSSILVNYIRLQQTEGMNKFMKEHPEAKVVVVDAKKPPVPRQPRTFDPNRS